jgi:FKBP-type peptidyl-prolyl cis-trans isomerase 2
VAELKIETGRRVVLKVDLSVVGGQQLEKSTIEFVQGSGTMPAFVEAVIAGLEKGAKRDGVFKAKDAFGNPATQRVKTLKRSEFPASAKLEKGERFAAQDPGTKMNVVLQIEKVTADSVDVRYIHPLADKDIKYALEVVQVSDPRPPPMPAAALELEEET